MNSTLDISINKISNSRISQYDINDVPFGKCFSDHMFVAEYSDGEWNKSKTNEIDVRIMGNNLKTFHKSLL